MNNFFRDNSGLFASVGKGLLKNPLVVFIYSFFSKWYLIIALTAVVTVYWVFKALNDTGIIKSTEDLILKALDETKSVAQNCTPKILKLDEFWVCINNPPIYKPTNLEKQFIKNYIEPEIKNEEESKLKNPYEENIEEEQNQ